MKWLIWFAFFVLPTSVAFASPHLIVDLDLAGRAKHIDPATGPAVQYQVARTQLGLSILSDEVASAHIRFDAVRSAPENGYLGVEGESFVPRLIEAFAQLLWQHDEWQAKLGAGLVPNTWILSGNDSFGYRAISAMSVESLGAQHRSDAGFLGTLSYGDGLTLHVSSLAGEGFRFRERNDEKNTVIHAQVAPLVFAGGGSANTLRLEALYLNGSQGLLSTKANRMAIRLSGGAEWLYGGVEWHSVDGLGDDPLYKPVVLSGWVRSILYKNWVLFGRYDHLDHAPNSTGATETKLIIGAGIDRRTPTDHRRWQWLTGYTFENRDVNARPLAGETVLDESQTIWLILAVQTQWAGRLQGD